MGWRVLLGSEGRGRPRHAPSLGLVAVLLLGALTSVAGCRSRVDAWERFDLRALPPVGSSDALGDATVFLGPEDVRDRATVAAWNFDLVRRVSAGRLRALTQTAGSRIEWEVPSGRDAYVSVTPLAEAGCVVRARISTDRAERPIWEGELVAPDPFAAAALELVLPPRSKRLVLEVDDTTNGCRALWGGAALHLRRAQSRPQLAQPNVILLGLDTLRADAVGAWGREPSLTPALDRLAAESDVYLAAYASANSTNPSFASLLTGLWVKNHGVADLTTKLPAEVPNLATTLGAAGWETMAVLAAGHVPPSLSTGFERVMGPAGTFAGQTAVEIAIDWLGGQRERPFFLWLHLFDPHTPHTPPREYAEGRRPAAAFGFGPITRWTEPREPHLGSWTEPVLGASLELYDAEVSYTDRQVDRFLGWLEARGLLEQTLVVVVADHGENLEDHGVRFRHAGLWETTVHVPLMVRAPGPARPGRRFDQLVQHFDATATVLETLGLDTRGLDARPLGELVASGGRRMVFAESADATGAMIRTRTHKLIRLTPEVTFAPPGDALYDLEADPLELDNLAGRGLAAEQELAQALERWSASRRARGAPRQLTAEEESELRALGYL